MRFNLWRYGLVFFIGVFFLCASPAFANGLSWKTADPHAQPSYLKFNAGPLPGFPEDLAEAADKRSDNSAVVSTSPLDSNSPGAYVWTGKEWKNLNSKSPLGSQSPVISTRPMRPQAREQKVRHWYNTDLGIAGIGVAATGAAMLVDHGINHYAQTHVSYDLRHHTLLNFADVLTDGSLIFMGATWFQSPWANAKLAHASSVALTAATLTTLEGFVLKFAIGRERPSGPDSSSTQYHPFSSRYDLVGSSFLFNNSGSDHTASLPSGHTAIAFAVITPYAQIYHQPWLYAIPVAVGLSRIFAVDGHWASDVVAGGFLGWLTADLTNRYFPKHDFGFMIFRDGVAVYKKY